MALSPAEKLQALATQHSTWISSLVNKYVLDNGTGGERINVYYSDWKQDRGQAFQNICVLVYMIEKIPAQTLSVSATVLHNWLMREDSVSDETISLSIQVGLLGPLRSRCLCAEESMQSSHITLNCFRVTPTWLSAHAERGFPLSVSQCVTS